MKKIGYLLFVCIFVGVCILLYQNDTSRYPQALSRKSFDNSLGVNYLGKEFVFEKDLDREMGDIAHKLIEMRRQEWVDKAKSRIPLILHQVWVEDGEMPDDYARGAQSIKLFHKNVPYTLWTKKEYEPLLAETLGGDEWKNLPKSVLKNVVTAAILIKQGGVVIAPETECVQSITSLLSLGDCIVGFMPPSPKTHFKRRLSLSTTVVAAAPSHPLIEAWLKEMLRRSSSQVDASQGKMKDKKFYSFVVEDSLTSIFALQGLKCGSPLLLGPTYFCPISPSHIDEFQAGIDGAIHRSTMKKILQLLRIAHSEPYADITHETIILNLKNQVETKKEGC